MDDLVGLVGALPILCVACVIDRPGYNARYKDRYGALRWLLCKTAFAVVIERAAKHVRAADGRLRVYVERCDPKTDRRMREYYEDLRTCGHPFSDGAQSYDPLTAQDFTRLLYEFRAKTKSSALMQIADIVLWPMCIGGYLPKERGFRYLVENGKLLDALYPDQPHLRGIKYSCFELWHAKNKTPP